MEREAVNFHPQFAVNFSCAGNSIRQMSRLGGTEEVSLRPGRVGKRSCQIATREDGSEVLITTSPIPEGVFDGDILRIQADTLDAEALAGDAPRRWIRSRDTASLITAPRESVCRSQRGIGFLA
jgi:hypothetical protein